MQRKGVLSLLSRCPFTLDGFGPLEVVLMNVAPYAVVEDREEVRIFSGTPICRLIDSGPEDPEALQ